AQRAVPVPAGPAMVHVDRHALRAQAPDPAPQQRRGLAVEREHPSRTADEGVHAQPACPGAQRVGIEPLQPAADLGRALAVAAGEQRARIGVGEVEPALAGDQELAAYRALALVQVHAQAGLAQALGREQAGGPAADHRDAGDVGVVHPRIIAAPRPAPARQERLQPRPDMPSHARPAPWQRLGRRPPPPTRPMGALPCPRPYAEGGCRWQERGTRRAGPGAKRCSRWRWPGPPQPGARARWDAGSAGSGWHWRAWATTAATCSRRRCSSPGTAGWRAWSPVRRTSCPSGRAGTASPTATSIPPTTSTASPTTPTSTWSTSSPPTTCTSRWRWWRPPRASTCGARSPWRWTRSKARRCSRPVATTGCS